MFGRSRFLRQRQRRRGRNFHSLTEYTLGTTRSLGLITGEAETNKPPQFTQHHISIKNGGTMNSNNQLQATVTRIGTVAAAHNLAPATAVAQLTRLLRSPLATLEERNEVAATVEALSPPANPVWIMARVAALLTPYYEKNTPLAVREIEAEDWMAALSGFPQWAIDSASRWWKSPENPRLNHKPIEGNIAARCLVETDALRAGKIRIAAFDAGQIAPKAPEPERKTLSAEERAALAASLGLPATTPKRFPQQGAAT